MSTIEQPVEVDDRKLTNFRTPRVMRRGRSAVAGVVVAALAVAAAPAQAATMVGQLFTPNAVGCSAFTGIQTGVASGNSYAVGAAGVITSWKFQESAPGVPGLKLKVVRPLSDGVNYRLIGESTAGAQTPNAVNSYPARISVQPGDEIGIFAAGGNCGAYGTPEDTLSVAVYDMPLGATDPLNSIDSIKLPVAAYVEPDADHDNFGDETQDRCPGTPGTDGGCPPPAPPASITSPPADKTPPAIHVRGRAVRLSRGGSVSFFVTASESSTGTATGSVRLPGRMRVLRFSPSALTLPANATTKVTLELSKRSSGIVRKALSLGKRPSAAVTLILRDAAGNQATRRLALQLNGGSG